MPTIGKAWLASAGVAAIAVLALLIPATAAAAPTVAAPALASSPVAASLVAAPGQRASWRLPSSDVIPFGADYSFQWTNGVAVSILSAAEFTPSATATDLPAGDAAVKIVVRITNGTKTVFDVSGTTLEVKSGPDGTQDSGITDLDNQVTLGLEGSIAPGHSATAAYGFGVPHNELSLIDVEVTPGFDYDGAIFEGPVT